MPLPDSIAALVARFDAERKEYHQGHYNETQTRIDYVNPLFAALGWDMNNTQGLSEPLREVVHEDALKIGGTTKAPDYSFRTGGARKFFLETKKPSVSVDLKEEPAYQLRRYAWTAKLPVSILTNFEEFAVYDGRIPPDRKDSPKKARLDYFKFTDYAARWDDMMARFSKDAVLSGAFDRYAEEAREKRLSLPVDAAFLAQISGWREKLASHIIQKNAGLAPRELNYAVQMIIDRIIFLRISEDRGIEPAYLLQPLLNKGGPVYPRLLDIFRRADDRYNSGLFHLKPEKGRGDIDDVTPRLTLDDRPLKEMIASIYYPESPFEFSVFPADILGHVYEQFLGKVIHVSGKTAVVEDKPEVKKAGGVYYTPTYIVEYIVQHTVGKLVENKTPAQVAKLTVLDPACGSGSFLIGAYQFLLDWHLRYYTENDRTKWARGKNAVIYPFRKDAEGGELWRLTTAEKKRILLANIYGVDIDTQAVEVTKLSLLLKVLENESAELIDNTLKLLQERALPDLESNIKCGNSLIGPDFYTGKDPAQFDLDARLKINTFDWHKGFPAAMKSGGFDAVIGNPPYGFHQIHSEEAKHYLKSHFETISGSYENYFLFYERSLKLLNNEGYHGFIVPVTWLTIPSGCELRGFILKQFAIRSIDWLPELVFKNAQVNTLISVIQKSAPSTINVLISKVNDPSKNEGTRRLVDQKAQELRVDNAIYIFEDETETALLQKILSKAVALSTLARPCSGYNPYEVGKGLDANGQTQTLETVKLRPYHKDFQAGHEWYPDAVGKDLGRYTLRWPINRFVKYGTWLAAARDPANYVGQRILVQEITGGKARRIIATYCDQELYHSRDIIPIKLDKGNINPFYLLGIVNSTLVTWWHHKRNPKAEKALFPKVLVSDLKSIPIREIDFSNPVDKVFHDEMVKLVNRMLTLHRDKATRRLAQEKAMLEQEIEMLDAQIDGLVYALYGLTAEEIAIVQGAG